MNRLRLPDSEVVAAKLYDALRGQACTARISSTGLRELAHSSIRLIYAEIETAVEKQQLGSGC